MSEKTYHIVMVMSESTRIQSVDLFIDDEEGAKQLFKEKIKAELEAQGLRLMITVQFDEPLPSATYQVI